MSVDIKNSGPLIYVTRKIVEYGALFLAAWQLGLPAAQNWVHQEIDKSREQRKQITGKWLNEKLVDEYNVPADRLHIYMGEQNRKLDTLYNKFNNILPYMTEELQCVIPRLIIRNGREFWLADDGEEYRVDRTSESGQGFYWRDGRWNEIFK